MVEYKNGTKKLIVTGGYQSDFLSSTEELDLDTLQWNAGTDLPEALDFGASVQFKDSFLAISGYSGFGFSNKIYEYNRDSGDWIKRNETLITGRDTFSAFLVPEEVTNCN